MDLILSFELQRRYALWRCKWWGSIERGVLEDMRNEETMRVGSYDEGI
jgi:hypothetical protein